MKRIIYLTIIMIGVSGAIAAKPNQIVVTRLVLYQDSLTQKQIAAILGECSLAIRKTMADTILTEEQRWERATDLIKQKHERLSRIADPETIKKLLPNGGSGSPGALFYELKAINPKRYANYLNVQRTRKLATSMQEKYGIDSVKADTIAAIWHDYKSKLKYTTHNLNLEQKAAQTDHLNIEYCSLLTKYLTEQQLQRLLPGSKK